MPTSVTSIVFRRPSSSVAQLVNVYRHVRDQAVARVAAHATA